MTPTSPETPPEEDKDNNNSNTPSAKKSDADCYNCVGVYFYSDELRKLGKKPVCYGVEYKASKTIHPDRMLELESLPAIGPNTKSYMVGLSQSSARMHRMGQMPLVKYGVQIVVAHQEHQAEEGKGAIPSRRQRPIRPRPDAQESTENQGGAFDPTINPPNSKPLNEPRKPPMTNLERMVSTVSLKTFENFFVNYQKSCSKLWNGMGVTFTKTFTNFPERMYHGAERLGKGCSKMADRTVEGFKKIFGDDASPK